MVGLFTVCALGSGDSETGDQGSGKSETGDQGTAKSDSKTSLGDYTIVISSCRLAMDYQGEKVAIIKYKFTNNADEATAFYTAFDAEAFQDGVGLNKAYVLKDSAKYSADNQTKAIKKGASINVEVAYELNDSKTPVDVEVKELFSFDDKVIKKTFEIK